jgi:hypothetical protein
LGKIEVRPEVFAEIEPVTAVENDGSDVPIPAVRAKAAHEA